MSKRADEIEPHSLDGGPLASKAQASSWTLGSTVGRFFRKTCEMKARGSIVDRRPLQPLDIAYCERSSAQATLYMHWEALRAEGIAASQFIAFLQPFADLEGITVSYSYSHEDGTEHVYSRRRGEVESLNPLSQAIQEKRLTKEKAMMFALNEEGRVWIESNFIGLEDLK